MDTLEYWEERLAVLPTTIDCSEMHILGEDRQAPVFAGPGHIDIKSENDIDFTMYGTSTDGSDAIQRLCRAYENPYQVADQFVLEATDYRGTQWNCGWTHPEYKDSTGSSYLLMGTVNSLVTLARGHAVSKTSSIELIFPPDLWMPMDKTMVSVSSIDGAEVAREYRPGQQAVNVLDSEIKFFYRPPSNSLWLTAATSDTLVHPYAESWVCEPLRILLGQLVYPRLVARNFGDGTAHVWLRRSARLFSGLGIASLLSDDPDMRRCFWELYARLLQLIAKPKIASSLASLELHPITRFYEELIRASEGSRWVLCMTLSSVVEGLVRLMPSCTARAKIDNHLKMLVREKIITEENQQSWTRVRHAVMHGRLTSPWGTEKEDEQVNQLIDLVHRLTRELLQQGIQWE